MKINLNNTSFLKYLDEISLNIMSKINIKHYFSLTDEQKTTISYTVFNLLKAYTKIGINDDELKGFIIVLRKKNEQEENYEFASILNDIINDFNHIIEIINTKKTEIKKKKIEK